VTQSIGQLANYIKYVNNGYGNHDSRQLWVLTHGRTTLIAPK
jgi:hypothetical protein